MENKVKQLIAKLGENFGEIYPLNYINNILDKESGETLTILLTRCNHVFIPFTGDKNVTRAAVPYILRRKGLYITYVTIDSEIITEYFKGNKTQTSNEYWTKDEYWGTNLTSDNFVPITLPDGSITADKLSQEVLDLIGQGFKGNIENHPDGEDLTSVELASVGNTKYKVLKFADRNYTQDGMGYVILRKNKSFEEQVTKSNTIYEIRYNFDLNGKTVNIPEGCVLKFEGGSLSSGTLNCNNTLLNGYNFIDKTIVLHGTIANEYIEFDWFKNEKWSISDSRYSNFINGSNTEFGEIPTISDANRTILENLLYNQKETYFNIDKAIKFGSGIYPFDSSVNVDNRNIFYLFGTHKWQTLLWSPNDDMFKVTDQFIGRSYPRLLNVSIEAKNNIFAHYNPTDAVRAILGYRIQGCRLISYEKHIIHPLADYDTDEAMVGHKVVIVFGSELKDCEIYANGHSKTIIDEEGNNIGASAIFNCNSNSWVYDNVVDSHTYFNNASTRVKGLMFTMFYNSSFLEMSKSNISYGGFEYLIYLKGSVHYNYIHNCTLELPTNITKYIYYSDATNSRLIINDCNIIGVNKVRLGSTSNCVFESNIANQLSIERNDFRNFPSYNTEFKGHFAPNIDSQGTVGRLIVTKTSDNNAYGTFMFANIQEVIDEIKERYKISGDYTPQDVTYCNAYISDAPLLRYPIHSDVLNTKGVIRVVRRDIPRLAYTDRENNTFAVFSTSNERIYCVSTLEELKKAFSSFAGQTPDVLYNYAVIVKDIDLNGESVYCRNSTIWCFGGSLTNGALTGVHNIIDFSGDATITFDAKAKTTKQYIGKTIFNNGIYKVWDGKKWVTCNGISEDAKTSGTFGQKPTTEQNIPIGYAYFCTDKQTAEGTTNGIMIYHKGNDVWVDALGRVIDDNYPIISNGTTEQRPVLLENNKGYQYFDTTLGKYICWNGTTWINLDGTPLA